MKTKINTIGIGALVALLIMVSNFSFGQVSYKLDAKKSSMVIKGTSTIHDWEMNVEDMQGAFTLQEANSLEKLTTGNVVVNVGDIKSEHSMMDKKTYDALKKDDFPQIKAKLLQVENGGAAGKVDLEVTIAGKTQKVADNFQLKTGGNGVLEVKGVLNLKMSDFGVEPPVALMGTIKAGDAISVDYDLVYTAEGQVLGNLNK